MKYTEEHEWLLEEGDLMVVGISTHAAEQLGDVVFVELPEVSPSLTTSTPAATCLRTVSETAAVMQASKSPASYGVSFSRAKMKSTTS